MKGITSEPSLNPDVKIDIAVQAVHLGEMHFIISDAERLGGGFEVHGNGLGTAAQLATIVWYDPFSRSTVCGSTPTRVWDGGVI